MPVVEAASGGCCEVVEVGRAIPRRAVVAASIPDAETPGAKELMSCGNSSWVGVERASLGGVASASTSGFTSSPDPEAMASPGIESSGLSSSAIRFQFCSL